MAKTLLMVGTQKGMFFLHSDEKRESWSLEGPILKGWKIQDVQLDQRSKARMYAAVGHFVYGQTIQISDDLGKTWQQVEHGPHYAEDAGSELKDVWCVVPGRASEPDTVYAGVAEAGLFVSHDRGVNWEEMTGVSQHLSREEWIGGLGGLCCHTIIPHPDKPQRLWVAISAVGVLRSDDGGETFHVKNDGLIKVIEGKTHKDIGSCVHRMVIDPQNPDRLFQQNHRGVYRSEDGGDSWQTIESGLPGTFGFPIVVNPHHPDTLFTIPQESDEFRMAKDGVLAVYRTTDGGASWAPSRKGLPDNCYVGVLRQAMTVDSYPDCGVYFGTSGGQIYYSRNNGDSWETMPCNLPRISSLAVAIIE